MKSVRMFALIAGRKLFKPKFHRMMLLTATSSETSVSICVHLSCVSRDPRFPSSIVGNHLHEDRGQLDLDGGFNNLNQLTALRFDGKLDIYGSIVTTNSWWSNKVDGVFSIKYNGTNYLGGGRINTGVITNSIVTWDASGTNEILRTVRWPLTKPQTFLWDLNGNLTNDGQKAYFWDEENRLTDVSSASVVASYKYDAQGRRVQKVVDAITNTFVYDGWNLIQEVSIDGVTNRYVWGHDLSQSLQGVGGIGGLLCVIRNGTPYYPCGDGNGNITDYITTNGTVVAHREYDPFGRTVLATGPMVNDFHFWFSSKYLDQETGLYYYGSRYYSPNLHVWISRDTIQDVGSISWFGNTKEESVIWKYLAERGPIGTEQSEALFIHIAKWIHSLPGEKNAADSDIIARLIKPVIRQNVRYFAHLTAAKVLSDTSSLSPMTYVFLRNDPIDRIDSFGLQEETPGIRLCVDKYEGWYWVFCRSWYECAGQRELDPSGCDCGKKVCLCNPNAVIDVIRCCCGCVKGVTSPSK